MIRIITAMTAPVMKYHNTLLAQMPPQLYGVDVGPSAIRLTSIALTQLLFKICTTGIRKRLESTY
jgi:hypothetical protein